MPDHPNARRRLPAFLLTAIWALWMLAVWFANYVECDDRLRDLGTRFEAGELERCTLPQRPLEVHELYWLIGTLTYAVSIAVWWRSKSSVDREGESAGTASGLGED